MYEKVWSGDVDGYEISLDFIEHRGLFRYTAKKDGVLISDRLCADPVDAGLMDGPGVMYNFQTPFVPNGSEIEFEGRFAPFHTPEEIASGTWLSPADWPQDRKRAAVEELDCRMKRVGRYTSGQITLDETYLTFGLIDCSKRLNAMFGGPDNWPKRAFELLFTSTGYKWRTLHKRFSYNDSFGFGHPSEIPPEVAEQISRAATRRGPMIGYGSAVSTLCRQSNTEYGGNASSFEVLPFVNAAEFIDEIRHSDRITVDLYADFNGDDVPIKHLGMTAVSLNSLDAERIRISLNRASEKHGYYWSMRGEDPSSKLNLSFSTFELTELVAAIKSCADWSLFFNHQVHFPDLGYGLDANGDSDRILLACGMSEWRSDDAQEWMAVSRSKSDRLYHIERIDAWDSYEGPEFEVTESSATKIYPSDLIDQIAADHNEFRETDGLPPFINVRYAAQLEYLREVYPLRQKTPENTPSNAALKDGLARLEEKKAEDKKTPSHNRRPGYFTY
ncbi:hypothetical protein ABG977_04665 [Collinsella aerofaciens]|uniref:hypothetical protein n=1 Tax=Collinsella aerofaciens TaxID=74426 RepID=UPI00325A8ED3